MGIKYFQGFNYSLANEDFQIEVELSRGARSIAAVCGSGLRGLNLIKPDLEKLTLFDISQTQLDYAQFQVQAIQELSYLDYLKLFGFQSCDLNERVKLRNQLSEKYSGNSFLNKLNYEMLETGIIYSGRWESFVIKIAKVIRFFLDYDFDSELYQGGSVFTSWPKKKLQWLLNIIARPLVFNLFLYRGHMPSQVELTLGELVIQGIDWIVKSPKLKQSTLHQLFFIGEIKYKEGIDSAMNEEQFNIVKKFQGKIDFELTGLTEALKKIKAEFWSVSDVLSYLPAGEIKELSERVLQSSYQRIVMRTFRNHPELDKALDSKRNRDLENWAMDAELTRLYRFKIYDK